MTSESRVRVHLLIGTFFTHIAHEAFEQDQLCLQLFDPEGQLILTHLALLEVLHTHTHTNKHSIIHILTLPHILTEDTLLPCKERHKYMNE